MHLYNGDCLEELQQLEDNSVDSVVTDPPYGLSFMGKKWDYDVPPKEVWLECLRVLKPGGFLLSFGGSRTYHRMAVEIEDAGFEIRDQIMWVYGSGFPKSRNLGDGWGSALKPAHEPIVMARKPFKGSLTKNHNTYGTGGINIDDCRVGLPEGDALEKGITGREMRQLDTADTETQWGFKSVDREAGQGRYPANFIHDGSDEVVSQFPDSKTTKSKLPKGTGGIWSDTSNTPCGPTYNGEGSAARFFYCAKASKKDRNAGCEGMEEKDVVTFATANGTSGKASSLSEGRNTKYQNNHPTVKPQALMAYLCRLVTQPGGVVLDPFMGSGSTGRAALAEGFDFIGVEREPEYFTIAQQRINYGGS